MQNSKSLIRASRFFLSETNGASNGNWFVEVIEMWFLDLADFFF